MSLGDTELHSVAEKHNQVSN